MKLGSIFLLALVVLPVVVAKQIPLSSTGQEQLHNVTPSTPYFFRGLLGIFGVNVAQVEPERRYGPQREFGKLRPSAPRGPKLPEHYVPLGGTANQTVGVSRTSCAEFGCKPGQYIIADTSTKAYYHCYCKPAAGIKPENRKCLDTAKIAVTIGYHEGPC